MVDIFLAAAESVASALGTSTAIAGFILGLGVILAITLSLLLAIGDVLKGWGIMIPMMIGFAFVNIVGWWPLWTVIVIVLLFALIIIKPFGERMAED